MKSETIAKAIYYAKKHLGMKEEDEIYLTNLLLSYFKVDEPYEGEIDYKHIDGLKVPDEIVNEIVEDFVSEGVEKEEANRRATYVMGLLTPLPSEVSRTFYSLYEKDKASATSYLYRLSIANDYIAKSKVDKNELWLASYESGSPLEISINLSKPEKNNKDIAKLLKAPSSTSYPKCVLCKENLGFEGNDHHPARGNIRTIPLTLAGDRWYFQYSPYVYYNEHCILFYEKHVPMEISPWTFTCLFDFVDLFPHYFIGSNSDLPIVGGSILNHEHFQGGEHLLPLLLSKDRKIVPSVYKNTTISIVDFYDTAIRLKGKDRDEILLIASRILSTWLQYDDPENSIISHDEEGRHNALTPIVRKNGDDYEMTILLRNNKCNETYPDGIFHAHPEYHHIKKEGIGLIEAAGLFILPARLKRQCQEVEEVVKEGYSEEKYLSLYPDLSIFKGMIKEMKEKGISSREYINDVCKGILINVAVFKNDEKGNKGLDKFLKEAVND